MDALGPDSFQSLLSSFRGSIPVRLGEIRAAIDGNDVNAIAAAAHSLKGAASNLGFLRLADAAGGLEKAGKAGGGDFEELEQKLVVAGKAAIDHLSRANP